MKKNLFSTLVCLLLCAVMLISPVKVTTAQAAEDTSALVGSSLYFDDQVDLQLFFDAEILSQKGPFTLTTDFNGKTYDETALVEKQDPATGKIYKVLSVGPFSATEYNTAFTYSGSAMTSATFSLVDLARNAIFYYENTAEALDGNTQVTLDLMKAFVNYGIAVENKATDSSSYLPYEVNFTAPEFTAHPGIIEKEGKDEDGNPITVYDKTPLNPERSLTGRRFVLGKEVMVTYEGALDPSDDFALWTVTVNGVNVTEKCNFTVEGEKFYFTVPLLAEQGQEKLRIIVRDDSGNTLYDCIDRADALAVELGSTAGYEELSATLAAFLQASYNYAYNPNPGKVFFEADTFYAGFGKVDISPYADKVMLNSAYADEFETPVSASCVALRDAQGTVSLIFSLDIRNIQSTRNQVYQTIRQSVSEMTGVDPENIFFNATHNHSAPSVTSNDATVTAWYNEYFYPRVPVAAKKALDDLSPVTGAYTGETSTASNTNYNRRYKSSGYEDGADKTLRTIRFARDAKKDILIVNWQCHAAHAVKYATKGSADFISRLRLVVEEETANGGMGMHLLYINGASGDLSMTARGVTEHPEYRNIGDSVAGSIRSLVGSSKEKATTLGNIQIKKSQGFADLQYRKHTDGTYCYDAKCESCKKDYWTAKSLSWQKAGFNSETEYNAYVNQRNGDNLSVLPTTVDLWTMTIGNKIGFAFVPYEMFNQNGVDLRAAVNTATGGGKTIITAGYTNGYLGYMPSDVAWDNVVRNKPTDPDGAHEVHSTHYVRGTAERFLDILEKDLTDLFNN